MQKNAIPIPNMIPCWLASSPICFAFTCIDISATIPIGCHTNIRIYEYTYNIRITYVSRTVVMQNKHNNKCHNKRFKNFANCYLRVLIWTKQFKYMYVCIHVCTYLKIYLLLNVIRIIFKSENMQTRVARNISKWAISQHHNRVANAFGTSAYR